LDLFAAFFASSPLASFPTIQPLLIAADVFVADCGGVAVPNGCALQNIQLSNIYTINVGVSLGFTLIFSLWYDHWGARKAMLFGGLGATIGLVILFFAIQFQKLNWYFGIMKSNPAG
jgi:hypothetical protein